MDFFEIEVAEPYGRSKAADMKRMLDLLRPGPSPAPLIRVGPPRDGGYLLPYDLDGVTACFSPGVNNAKPFEDMLAEKHGIAAHLCDASSDVDRLRTPLIEGMQTFEKLWLDTSGAADAVSLDAWVARHRPDPEEDLMLQIDIEGAEYRNILAAQDDTLKRFRIIVLEVHDLKQMTNDKVLSQVLLPFFERFEQHFTCVHAHPNNAARSIVLPELGVSIPDVLELTYIRKDRFENRELHAPQLPHPYDIRFNVPRMPPMFLDDVFRGRAPSPQELFRMSEDMADWRHRELTRKIDVQNKFLRKALGEGPGKGRA